ncbi:MAG: DUF488 domain-containing protein [Chloroflexi bacterium]|nr:DUF488 domain-containing protein [Chloroflexota bacterium]
MIAVKRVYDPDESSDGTRFLVERLWPRGIRKADLRIDAWLKDVGPSTELRHWFNHDPARWNEFRKRYAAELEEHPDTWERIVQADESGTVTLLYSAHDTEHNNAVALKEYLDARTAHARPTHH